MNLEHTAGVFLLILPLAFNLFVAIGLSLVAGSLEFVGHFEEHGWKLAGTIIPIAYTAWSLWLIVTSLVLLFA
jgi:hypothetical protein